VTDDRKTCNLLEQSENPDISSGQPETNKSFLFLQT